MKCKSDHEKIVATFLRNINTTCEQNAESVMLQQMVCTVTAKIETLNKRILKKF
jgi:hypothetical protein